MRYFGKIGFSNGMVETSPGVWEDKVITKNYYGIVNKRVRRWQGTNGVNDDLNITNTLEITADEYLTNHFTNIRYVEYLGAKWKVSDVDFSEWPRLMISLGGVYNA